MLSPHCGGFGSPQPSGAACAKPLRLGGSEGWLGSVGMGLSSPPTPLPVPMSHPGEVGALGMAALALLAVLGKPRGAPGEMLVMLLVWSAARWAPVTGSGEGQGCPGPPPPPPAPVVHCIRGPMGWWELVGAEVEWGHGSSGLVSLEASGPSWLVPKPPLSWVSWFEVWRA